MVKWKLTECTVDQARQTRKNTYSTWGEPLGFSEDAWIQRFETLERGNWAKGDRYRCWALVDSDEPSSLDMLAHCETFRRPSLARSNGATREVVSYGIAGVFTPIHRRGHGHARRLLSLLHYVIAPTEFLPPFPADWGQLPLISGFHDATFSVLYSGVGEKYYASCRRGEGSSSQPGWERQHVVARTWSVPPASGDTMFAGASSIGAKELAEWEFQAAMDMRAALNGRPADDVAIAILPEESLFSIHAERYRLSPAFKSERERHFGLVLEQEQSTPELSAPFIVYTFPESGVESRTLELLYVRPPFPFQAVLHAAQVENCTEVKMWGARGQWDEHRPYMDAESEMPCLVIYDKAYQTARWEILEQYTWC